MYYIKWSVDNYTEKYADEVEWEARLDEIAEDTCFDIDIEDNGNIAIIDDGDPE